VGMSISGAFVFGLALSVASTVVLLRALEADDGIRSPEGRIAVGWLVVEDLVTMFVLVLLPTIAPLLDGAPGAGTTAAVGLARALGVAIARVGSLVALMLLVGRRLAPWMPVQVERTGSPELFTLAVVSVALGVAFASAELFGTSFALGAFFAGVVLHESEVDDRAATTLQPFQDAFAALFFVAAGMLFDPGVLVRDPLRVAIVAAIVILGKAVVAFAIVRMLRHPLRAALTIAAALSQIGEFSFILASLGVRLQLLSPDAYQLIVAAALLSIAFNPVTLGVAKRGALARGFVCRV